MDLASILHDSPSDDLRRRQPRQDTQHDNQAQQSQQYQQPQRPPHHSPTLDRPRDQLRDRDRAQQDLPHSHPSQHASSYRRSPPPHHTSRPPSPPRHPPPYGAPPGPDFSRHQLPPLLSDPAYDVGGHPGRRQEGLGHPHDRMGPSSGHPSSSVQVQPFTLEHRTTPGHHSHPHPSHHHALPHPTTPSAVYMGPPPSRSIHASPPHSHHSSHGPGQGSIPLFPTPVGPGVPPSGPPPPGPPGGMSLRLNEPAPPMFPGMLSHGPSPHLQHPHPHHGHHRDDRHRPRGASTSSAPGQAQAGAAEPVMASLQRPAPYDDRDHDRDRDRERERAAIERERGVERDPGPGPMQGRPRRLTSGSIAGSLSGPSGSSLSLMPTPMGSGPPPHPPGSSSSKMLGGYRPSAGSSMEKIDNGDGERERERGREARLPRGMERSLGRDEQRERGGGNGIQDSPGAARREREMREREKEQRERERQVMKERDRQERHQREREMRERDAQIQMEREREREMREREMQEREIRERQRQREMAEREQLERERQQEGYRRHIHELMGVSPRGIDFRMPEFEDREWQKQKRMQQQQQQQGLGHPDMRHPQGQPPLPPQHEHGHHTPLGGSRVTVMGPPAPQGPSQGQVWPRFVPPAQMPEEERMLEREMQERRRMEDIQPRELEWESREPRPEREPRPSARSGKSRANAKEERERAKAAALERGERPEPPPRKPRMSAREKEQREREKMERAEMEHREREQREREHQHRVRERETAVRHEAQHELREQERIQRIQEEAARATRAQMLEAQGIPYNMHVMNSQPQAGPPFGPDTQNMHSKLGAMPLPPDLPPHYQHERDLRFIPKAGPGPINVSRSQQIPPHPHPLDTPHMRHPQEIYGPGPIGMQSRRSSPPLPHSHTAPIIPPAYMLPRSGSPTTPLVLPLKNLGTFVYPRTPFPFLDFPPPYTASGVSSDPLDIRATIFLPTRFIPLTRPTLPRIWGGALIPAVAPLSGAQRQQCAQHSGSIPQYGRPWPDEVRDGRRVYTDDSDLFLCALHAGWVSWSQARKARREGNDLRIDVRLTREARYIGGYGNALRMRDRERGEVGEDLGAEDDGRELLSSGWGNGHDGAGMEILKAEFVMPGTAHSFGLRNRSQRMLEYAERRGALGCALSRSSRKRRRVCHGAFSGDESAVQMRINKEDDEASATRVMVFGTDSSWPEIGFKYHPDALRTTLFPPPVPPEGRPAKRRKLAADKTPSVSPPPPVNSDDELVQQRAVVVETLWESFLISHRGQIPSGGPESDKENAAEATSAGSGRRYVIALLTNAGGTLGKLSKSASVKANGKITEGVVHGLNAADETVPGADAVELPHTNGEADGDAQRAVVPAAPAAGAGTAGGKTLLPSPSSASIVPPSELGSLTRAPSSDGSSTDDGNGPLQILHRDLGEENFEFGADGISILSQEAGNGTRKGWKLEAQQWKWVQVGVSS